MTKASECGAWCQYDWDGNCDKEQCSGFLRCHPSPPPSPHVPPPPPPPPDETEALWDAIAALPTTVRPLWCTALDNRIDARRLPQLWCQDPSQGECDKYFVHAPRTGDVPCIWRVSTGQCLPGEDCIDAADFDRLMHVPRVRRWPAAAVAADEAAAPAAAPAAAAVARVAAAAAAASAAATSAAASAAAAAAKAADGSWRRMRGGGPDRCAAAVAAVSVRSGGAHGDRLPPILRLHRVWHRAAL